MSTQDAWMQPCTCSTVATIPHASEEEIFAGVEAVGDELEHKPRYEDTSPWRRTELLTVRVVARYSSTRVRSVHRVRDDQVEASW
jgi:hypothetical protein